MRPVFSLQVLLSEVTPAKLDMMPEIDVWVQVACPRLSIDWGEGFGKPTLTPFEAFVALGEAPEFWDKAEDSKQLSEHASVPKGDFVQYPMDYYARDGGQWSSSYHRQQMPRGAGVQLRPKAAIAVAPTG